MQGTVGSRAAVAAAVLVAVALRLALNDVTLFSPHDEAVYLAAAEAVAREGPAGGLREVLAGYLARPVAWLYPPPIRWGQHLLGGLACALGGARHEALAGLSTLAGVAVVVGAALLARRLGGLPAALAAVVLLLASPLWLHLGRRALADAPYAAAAFAAAWAFLAAMSPGARRGLVALAVALCALQAALKEGGALLLAALLVASAALAAREAGPTAAARAALRAGALLALAGGLAWLGFSLLVGSPGAYLMVVARIREAGPHNDYLRALQGGPPWRYLVDLALLSPGLLLLAPPALAALLRRDPARSPRARLAWGLAALAVAYATLLVAAGAGGMGYNARYLLPLDAPLRVLVAVWLVGWVGRAPAAGRAARGALAAGAVAVSVGVEAWVFRRVFLERGVYDPVTAAVAAALDVVPP